MKEIIYGIRNTDGKIISIDEVLDGMSGSLCDCICASCGRDLLACSLNGKVRRYFRHKGLTENLEVEGWMGNCNPIQANESALHKMAKQILFEAKRFVVPCKTITATEAGITDLPQEMINRIPRFELHNTTTIKAESVELEKHLEDFTPDAVLTTKRGELLVEIFVSHKVDSDKRQKARKYGAAMLEIDLRNYTEAPISSDELRSIIIDKVQDKKWVFYPLIPGNIAKVKQYYESIAEVKEYRKNIEDEFRKQQRDENNRQRRNKKIKNLFVTETYSRELKHLRNDKAFIDFCKSYSKPYWFPFDKYFFENGKAPFFIDIPITGEIVFRCDRRIWQSVLFNRFIYGRRSRGASFNIEKLFDDLRNDYQISVDIDLSFKLTSPWDDDRTIWLRTEVISQYMEYLELLGFISTPNDSGYQNQRNWKTVIAIKTIDPPNKTAEEELRSALESSDILSPKIDSIVQKKLEKYFDILRQKAVEEHERAEALQLQRAMEMRERERLALQKKAEEEAMRREKERLERERQEVKIQQERRENGFKDVSSYDFTQRQNRYDRYGKRWLMCSICGCIKREDEMSFYRFGAGECKQCLNSSKNR